MALLSRETKVRLGSKLIRSLDPLIASGSLVGNEPFFEATAFPWATDVSSQWQLVRRELDAVLERVEDIPPFQEMSPDQRRLSSDDSWRTYFFYAFGYKAERNCERCPETARLLQQIPGLQSAFFSILAPGKHIPAHRGAMNGLVRYHLALKVPAPAERCRIRVGKEMRHWREGEALFFDDTYEHEVWNDTDGTRAVLFVDFERPLRSPQRWLNSLIIGAIKRSVFVKDGIANYEAWQARLDRAAGS